MFPIPAYQGTPLDPAIPVAYHEAVARGCGLPLVAFQLQPALGGVIFSEETLRRIAAIDSVVALKEASFDARLYLATRRMIEKLDRPIDLLTGDDNFVYESFVMGAEGALIGFGTLATDLQVEMVRLTREGRWDEARAIWERILPLEEAVYGPPVRDYRARTKVALRELGVIDCTVMRPPLLPVTEDAAAVVRAALVSRGPRLMARRPRGTRGARDGEQPGDRGRGRGQGGRRGRERRDPLPRRPRRPRGGRSSGCAPPARTATRSPRTSRTAPRRSGSSRACCDRFGRVDGLVNNAGRTQVGPFLDIDPADWDDVLRTDLTAAFHTCRAVLPSMLERGSGAIVNVASRLGQVGVTETAAYSAAKAGLIGLTRALAREFGPRGIRVNAVAPGMTVTDMTTDLADSEEGPRRLRDLPLGRFGRADEVADAVVFLLSDASSLFLGQTLNPNAGGYMP